MPSDGGGPHEQGMVYSSEPRLATWADAAEARLDGPGLLFALGLCLAFDLLVASGVLFLLS